MRLTVARIVRETLHSLSLEYPEVDLGEKDRFEEMRNLLKLEAD